MLELAGNYYLIRLLHIMLTIRLQRTGTKNAASFRIVVAEKTAHVSKKFIEVLGSYNPRSKAFAIKNQERLDYWVTHNATMSPTVNNLLVDKGLVKTSKVKAFNVPKKEQPAAEAVVEKAPEEKPAEAPVEQAAETAEETPKAE